MLQNINYDPAKLVPRLGDGFYEQKLIREQIAELTDKRFLDDNYSNDEDQYKALINAGLYYASQFNPCSGIIPPQVKIITGRIN